MGTHLLLTRHGETEWHAKNRYAGTSEVALTPRGLAQAHALATFLDRLPAGERPGTLYCSPQGRARRTAEPTSKALGLPLRTVQGLREVHFGIAEGRTLDELAARHPEVVSAFREDPVAGAFPESEPPVAAAERGAAALRAIASDTAHGGGPVLVVAHNTLIRLTLCALLDIPLRTYRTVFPRLGNTALTEIVIDGTRTGLLRYNQPTGDD